MATLARFDSVGLTQLSSAIQGIRFASAKPRHSVSFSLLNGLLRKAAAPAPSAWMHVLSSGNAVTNMIGVRRPRAIRSSWSSNSAQALHVNVENETTGIIQIGIQKLFCRGEGAGVVTERPHQRFRGFPDEFIIVDNRDHRSFLVPGADRHPWFFC